MYCKNCKIETEDTYCEICGKSTVEGVNIKEPQSFKKNIPYNDQEEYKNKSLKAVQNISFKKVISLISFIVLFIGIVIGYNVLNKHYTPRNTVERYYDYLVNKDYDSAYDMLINTDESFLNKEFFKRSMENLNFNQFTIRNYKPEEHQQINSLNLYTSNISNSTNMFSVQANGVLYPVSVVNMGKKLLFFNDYKIDANNFSVKWQIVAPKGSNISILDKEPMKSKEPNIDGIFVLNDFYKPSSNVYEIPYIFNGGYDVKVNMTGAKEVQYSNVAAGKKLNVKFEPSDELVKELEDKAKSFLELYYSNSPRDKYSNLVTKDSNVLSKINNFGSAANDKVINKLKDIKITKQGIDDIEHAVISVKVTIDYEDSSWIEWGGQKLSGTKDVTTDFYFIKEGDKWLITDTSYIN